MVDAHDSKSCEVKPSCEFDSLPRHTKGAGATSHAAACLAASETYSIIGQNEIAVNLFEVIV